MKSMYTIIRHRVRLDASHGVTTFFCLYDVIVFLLCDDDVIVLQELVDVCHQK